MGFSLKTKIIRFFPKRYFTKDSNKDENGKGTFQRWQELLMEEYDENTQPLIENLSANLVNPFTALQEFLTYLEHVPGTIFTTANTKKRRKLIAYNLRFTRMRGTARCVKTLLKMFLGFEAVVTAHHVTWRFDDGTKLDTAPYKFDQTQCKTYCVDLSFAITGEPEILSIEQYMAIYSILEFNKPIDGRIREVTYNGDVILPYVVIVEINEEGYLVYNNALDPTLILTLKPDGRLYASGPRAAQYIINNEGYLIFTV